MHLKNGLYDICIEEDNTYTINSADNKKYDYTYNPNDLTNNSFVKIFSLTINSNIQEIRVAIIGDFYSSSEDCAILVDNNLTILQNDTILRIDASTGQLVCFKNIDTLGVNFSIYQVESGYIIYGEIEIIMLDFDFEVKWKFSARDIFVTLDNTKAFELCNDRIKLLDFEKNYYEIDFNGKLICDKKAR